MLTEFQWVTSTAFQPHQNWFDLCQRQKKDRTFYSSRRVDQETWTKHSILDHLINGSCQKLIKTETVWPHAQRTFTVHPSACPFSLCDGEASAHQSGEWRRKETTRKWRWAPGWNYGGGPDHRDGAGDLWCESLRRQLCPWMCPSCRIGGSTIGTVAGDSSKVVSISARCFPARGCELFGEKRICHGSSAHFCWQDCCCRVRYCYGPAGQAANHLHFSHQSSQQSKIPRFARWVPWICSRWFVIVPL